MDARRVRESRRGAAGVWVSPLRFCMCPCVRMRQGCVAIFLTPLEKKGKITLGPLTMRG